MARLPIYYVYLPFLILVCSHAASSMAGKSNVYTLFFGSVSTIADLHKEIKSIRKSLQEHHQSLNNLQKNYANLLKRLVKLEHAEKRQIDENLLLKIQNLIKLKINEQSKAQAQKQTNYKNTIQNILEKQSKILKAGLEEFENKVLNKMQIELDKKRDKEKQMDAQKPIDFLKNLLKNDKELKKLPAEADAILTDISNKIQNNVPVNSYKVDWPSFTELLPDMDDKGVEVNAKIAAGVKTGSSCDEALQDEDKIGGIYALNMTKYNLNNMYGYCLKVPQANETWLVIQRRINSELSFNRTWQDYKNGFGNLADSFFIGLERLHKILQNSHAHLWIQLGTEELESPYRIYTGFSISNEEDRYRLKSVYIDGFADNLFEATGFSFQTYDVQKNNRVNCAEVMQGGWWYDDIHDQGICADGNFNGKLENVTWSQPMSSKVVYTQMAIRLIEDKYKPALRGKN